MEKGGAWPRVDEGGGRGGPMALLGQEANWAKGREKKGVRCLG